MTATGARPRTVIFLGNFGTQNLGNECTLQAILQNLHRYLPDAKASCVCSNPEDTSRRHGIPAFPLSYRFSTAFGSQKAPGPERAWARWIRRIMIRMPLEVVEWLKAFRRLKGTDTLIMTGTGMLTDVGIGPLDLHYEILKWSIVAKLRRCRLLFVSVGAGPIDDSWSRRIVKAAISLADYRSYRDAFSKQFLDGIGFDTSRDQVYPDLVFSSIRPGAPASSRDGGSGGRTIGLGLMDYYGTRGGKEGGEHVYRAYVEQMARFAAWLLERGYTLRLLVGDLAYDRRVKEDVVGRLREIGVTYGPGRVIDEPVASVDQLWSQLEQTDMVVATRFHNVLMALMLSKPMVAVSFHEKVRSLMNEAGLAEYCQDIADHDLQGLIGRFTRLERNSEKLRLDMTRMSEEYRVALDDQYERIFKDP